MGNIVELLLQENELRKVESLSEILDADSFIVDSNVHNSSHFNIYPVIQKKLNLTHNILSLYGIHWMYKAKINNPEEIKTELGDVDIIFNAILNHEKGRRNAKYTFTQKYLDKNKSIWIFVPNTEGRQYYQFILLPRFYYEIGEY